MILKLKPTNNGRYSVEDKESRGIKIKEYKSDKGLEKVLEKAHNMLLKSSKKIDK